MTHSPAFVSYKPFSLAYFCYFIFVAAWTAFWPLWLSQQGFDAAQIGLLVACALATKIFAPSMWGYIADQQGKHLQYMRVCASAGLLCFVAILWKQNFVLVLWVVLFFSFFGMQ